jgi:hypothetical protein
MRTHWKSISSLLLIGLAGCAAPHEGGAGENVGSASIAITNAPPGVQCIQIIASGVPTITRLFDVAAGNSTVFDMGGLPVGGVDFSGYAYAQTCNAAPSSTPTWAADPVSTTVSADTVANITLEFHPTAPGSVTADFDNANFRSVTTLVGQAGVIGAADGTGPMAGFFRPHGIAADNAGHVFVADTRNHTIRMITVATKAVVTLAGGAGQGGVKDGVGTFASFRHPVGVAVDNAGSVYVTDDVANTIRRIDIATQTVTTLAGVADTPGSTDGAFGSGLFNGPYGVTFASGFLYVVDSNNATIRKVTVADGTVTTIAGAAGQYGNVDDTGVAARFNAPHGITTDGANLYVTDAEVLRSVEIATNNVTTIAGDPKSTGAADGYWTNARFVYLDEVAFDGHDALFITDANASTIRRMSLSTGEVSTVAGMANATGSSDGVGPAALFHWPLGVTVDAGGSVYVADALNQTIRKLD